MKIDVIVGCQFGSEAKGLVAGMLAKKNLYDVLVSVNSSQAGHTVPFYKDGIYHQIVTRQLPSSCVINHDALIYIGPGAVINLDVLFNEIRMLEDFNIPIKDRLLINPKATIISNDDINREKNVKLKERIGSTCEGVGSALSMRAIRECYIIENYRDKLLHEHNIHIGELSKHHEFILLEGSQGFGLSTFSLYYPYCTSRDTTTAAFLSYAQLPFRDVRNIYGVYRTFPIRVGGNSGPMYKETTWDEVSKISGYENLCEITTVTKRIRRIGFWDSLLAHKATVVNGVDRPILTFVNYLDRRFEGLQDYEQFIRLADKGIIKSYDQMSKDVNGFWALSTDNKNGWMILD